MVQINFARKEINCKIVYYGPGLSGKTTNLEIVHERAPEDNKGELTSISTDGDRTLFFDFMPLDLGTIAGMRTKFHIYTVPGQVYYNSTRKLVLLGADGVIFVADSSPGSMEANKQSLDNLAENLAEMGKDMAKVPLVIQYNKRDIEGAIDVDTLEKELNTLKVPSFEAVASKGDGVFQTLKGISSLVLESINSNERKATLGGAEPAPMPVEAVEEAAPAAEADQPVAQEAAESGPAEVNEPSPAPVQAPAAAAPAAGGGASSDMEIERNHIPSPQMPQQPAAPAQAEPAPMQAAAQRQNPAGDLSVDGPEVAFEASQGAATATLTEPEPVKAQPKVQEAPKAQEPVQQAKTAPPKPAAAPKPKQAPQAARPQAVSEPKSNAKPAQHGSMQVVGGKPVNKKGGSAMGIVIVVAVIVLLAGAGVAYYMMM